MKTITMNPFLRGALGVDAIGSGAIGAALVALPARLAPLFNLPQPMLFALGLFLVAYAAFVGVLATRQHPPALLVWLVIVGNLLWVVQSLVLLIGDWVAPSTLGVAFVLAQAVAVAVFAELQIVGVRKARPLAAAAA